MKQVPDIIMKADKNLLLLFCKLDILLNISNYHYTHRLVDF